MDSSLSHQRHLLLQIEQGNEEAFAELYKLYVPALSTFLTSLTHSSAITDELMQDIFLQVWLNRDKLSTIVHPKAWVFKVATNITYNFLRRKITERKILDNSGSFLITAQEGAEDSFYTRQLFSAVSEAVNQLTPQRKKIYLLSREGGLTIPEIAEKLSLSPSTVKNTLVASLEHIRNYLKSNGFNISMLSILFLKTL